jgi:hypothetical protein
MGCVGMIYRAQQAPPGYQISVVVNAILRAVFYHLRQAATLLQRCLCQAAYTVGCVQCQDRLAVIADATGLAPIARVEKLHQQQGRWHWRHTWNSMESVRQGASV